jgi:hypothetical protein
MARPKDDADQDDGQEADDGSGLLHAEQVGGPAGRGLVAVARHAKVQVEGGMATAPRHATASSSAATERRARSVRR